MSQLDEINAKCAEMYAKKSYYDQAQTPATLAGPHPSGGLSGGDACGVYDPSLRAEAEQRVGYHRSQAEKHDQAAAFFRENPAFDQFIRLIRSGAIQI